MKKSFLTFLFLLLAAVPSYAQTITNTIGPGNGGGGGGAYVGSQSLLIDTTLTMADANKIFLVDGGVTVTLPKLSTCPVSGPSVNVPLFTFFAVPIFVTDTDSTIATQDSDLIGLSPSQQPFSSVKMASIFQRMDVTCFNPAPGSSSTVWQAIGGNAATQSAAGYDNLLFEISGALPVTIMGGYVALGGDSALPAIATTQVIGQTVHLANFVDGGGPANLTVNGMEDVQYLDGTSASTVVFNYADDLDLMPLPNDNGPPFWLATGGILALVHSYTWNHPVFSAAPRVTAFNTDGCITNTSDGVLHSVTCGSIGINLDANSIYGNATNSGATGTSLDMQNCDPASGCAVGWANGSGLLFKQLSPDPVANLAGGSPGSMVYQASTNSTAFTTPVANSIVQKDGSGNPYESATLQDGINLGAISGGDLSNATGTATGLTAGNATNVEAHSNSVNNSFPITTVSSLNSNQALQGNSDFFINFGVGVLVAPAITVTTLNNTTLNNTTANIGDLAGAGTIPVFANNGGTLIPGTPAQSTLISAILPVSNFALGVPFGISAFTTAQTAKQLTVLGFGTETCVTPPTIAVYDCGAAGGTCGITSTVASLQMSGTSGTSVTTTTMTNPIIAAGDELRLAVLAGSCVAAPGIYATLTGTSQ